MSALRTVLIASVTALCAVAAGVPAQGTGSSATNGHWRCANGLISVDAPSRSSAGMVCQQAERARAFLAACGIDGRPPLTVKVMNDFEASSGLKKAGDYDPTSARVRLLAFASYARMAKPRLGTTPVLARVLHASVAAHEIAHGIFHDHVKDLDLPETAHEYVAYVVQLGTLPRDVQERLLAQSDVLPVNNLFIFSFFLLRADPERFAFNAWRHFNQPENGCAFLQKVIASKVHFPPLGE